MPSQTPNSPSRPPRVVVFVGPDHDLIHTSRFFTGLSALERTGHIHLRYVVPRSEDRWLASDPVVICLDVGTNRPRRVAVDLRDGLGMSWPIVDRVDVYFKRSFFPPEVASIAPHLGVKMRPFGLNYPCRSAASAASVLGRVGLTIARRGPSGVRRLRQYLATPGPEAFEQAPEAVVDPKVIFQTRLWSANEISPEEAGPLNESRVAMVRALRRAFGKRFVGGLMPTPLALARYPDDITRHPIRRSPYLAMNKTCLVSVYTPGVEHSLAFKLGETFAASQCLVSAPLKFQLPEPLIEGQNVLWFSTPQEAVAACEHLLAGPALASRMRHANHVYYRRHVEPAAHVFAVLAQCLHD